ncbi:electron transfer flavoprotein subunit beta/FixA family protein [Acidiplasma sp.]|jgi:electron transfer flavoprotein beta subunit|uniref:electron transfer flavoprotein subunit beta/FixA family protein n=1 Tax=Acidiplasma TaxID=507753 RepID=UPI0025832E56|nr:electron transfer flavoprotein subunit beta/FixA family protein [Acidiplasma sp.]
MNIAVLIKQTIDMDQLKTNENGEPILDNLPLKLDILSKNAIEAAVQLKEKYGGEITGISFGTDKTTSAIKEAYAMGVDTGVILKGYKKSNPHVTANVIYEYIKDKNFDIIILGNQSSDSYSGILAPVLSEKMKIPLLSNAIGIEIADKNVKATLELEEYNVIQNQAMPVVISVAQEINNPRLPNVMQIMKAGKKEIKIIDANPNYSDSPNVISNTAPKSERKRIIFENTDDGVAEISRLLRGASR